MTILLGLDAEGTTEEIPKIVHMLLLIAKQYIHNSKCHNTNICIQGLLYKIREIEKMEYIIAKTKGEKTSNVHCNKWKDFHNVELE